MAFFDINAFFSNQGGKSSFNYINFSDYKMIQSGSYKKLMKSYYAKQSNDTSSSKKTTNKANNKIDSTSKDLSGLSKTKLVADSLKKSADNLSGGNLFAQSNGVYDTDKITSAIKAFTQDYNSTIEQSSKLSSQDVQRQIDFMKSLTNTMSSALSKVGISQSLDGKLSFDADSLSKADMKAVKSLFQGSHSYASQIADKASAISSAALRNSSFYSNNGSPSSSMSSMFNDWV